MKTYIKFLLPVIFTGLTLFVQAQAGRDTKKVMKDRIDSQRIAFITEKLELTPSEAQVFWPLYNEFRSKQQELRRQFLRSDELDFENIDNLSDKEASELADNQLIFAQKQLDLKKEYHAKLKSVLPPRKVLKLYESEREFQKVLMNRIKERPGGPPPQNPRRNPQPE